MGIFQPESYISVDFQNKKIAVYRKGEGETQPGIPAIQVDEQSFEQGDALKSEIESFLDAINTGKTPVVSGEDGRLALETALKINKKL
jgi:predicted dehydrogenase